MTGEAWTLAEHIARRQGVVDAPLTVGDAVENAKPTFGEARMSGVRGAGRGGDDERPVAHHVGDLQPLHSPLVTSRRQAIHRLSVMD